MNAARHAAYLSLDKNFQGDLLAMWSLGAFQPLKDLIPRAFEPHIDSGTYALNIWTKFWRREGRRYTAKWLACIARMATCWSEALPREVGLSFSGPGSEFTADLPCPSCHGIGSGGPARREAIGVPPEVLALHKPIVAALMSDALVGTKLIKRSLRSLRRDWRRSVSAWLPLEEVGDVGLFQVVFKGTVYGFGAEPEQSIRLLHYPAVWTYPVNLDPKKTAMAGLDPNMGRRVRYAWHRRCEACQGRGFILEDA